MPDPGTPNVFALPPGTRFPESLVEGLIQRFGPLPEALARVSLYLNTGRMLAEVRAALLARSPVMLPRLRLVTDIGADFVPGLPPAVPPLRRRLELLRLVTQLAEGRSDITSGTAAAELSESLGALMEEMQDEGIPASRLSDPGAAGGFARHWERSLAFLNLTAGFLSDSAFPDAAGRQRRAVEALVQGWAARPPADPVIVAGSTGSRGTTGLLMRAVARLPNGAVVLPGFDLDLPAGVWEGLLAAVPAPEDHPQYRFAAFLSALGMSASSVRPWVNAAPPVPARNRLVSLALRPAPATDSWTVEGPALDGLADATEAVTLIEAPDPRIEALCIALSLRRAAEEGTRAILVTPDRTLARRVAAALDRWGIVPDDSAGEPLALSPTGRLLRQMARSFGTRPNAADLLALLKHPLAASGGGDRGPHLLFLREIELKLRRHGPAFPTGADVTAWASQLALPGIGPWADWLAALIDGLWLSGERELSSALDTHIAITTRLAAGPEGDVSALWQGADGSAARGIFDALAREAHLGGKVTPAAYSALVDSLLATEGVRTSTGAHPLVAIRGTLDARAGGGDLVILGGLNDGIWPPAPPPDPWLSRGMRAAMGFRSPERRIGLSAHDFQQAIAAPRIILTRAIRDSQTDTVPSRWLARLIHLLDGLPDTGGRAALTAMRARGNDLIRLARSIDAAPAVPAPARRPAPIPPPAARPLTLSLTDVPRLLLDPYEVYARRILRLSRLNPLRPEPSPRHLGEVMHQVLDRFISNRPADETADAALARLLGLAGTALDAEIPWPADRRIWRARFARAAGPLAGREADRADGRTSVTERKTSAALPPTGVTLAFRPDRIDAKPDGTIAVYDYKSTLHSGKRAEIDALQLQLAAHLVALGAFPDIKGAVTEAAFISYKDGEERAVDVAQADIAKALASVEPILRAYTSDLPFTALARPYGHNPDRPWDYDLLARHGEWELGDPPDIRPVP